MLADRKAPEIHMIFLDGDSMALAEEKSHVQQLSVTQYPDYHVESLAAAPEQVACITVVASDLDCEAEWDLAEFTEDPDLGSYASTPGESGCLREPQLDWWLLNPSYRCLWSYCHWQ